MKDTDTMTPEELRAHRAAVAEWEASRRSRYQCHVPGCPANHWSKYQVCFAPTVPEKS